MTESIIDVAIDWYQSDPSHSRREAARLFGIDPATLRWHCNRRGIAVNEVVRPYEDRRDAAMTMYANGMSRYAIAKALDVHKNVIKRWIDEQPLAKPTLIKPVILTVLEPIQPWEDSGEIIHMGNLGRVIREQFGQVWEIDE